MHNLTATEIVRRLRSGETSALDVMQAVYDRVEQYNKPDNKPLNAIVNLLPRDKACELARQADLAPAERRGALHGLPMACKDAVDVKGFPTTWGFAPFANKVANTDGEMVARLRRAGAIFIGKTNMPEFGLGSNTFNSVFGQSLNPYDTTKTPGGSSGGAAITLATRMLWLADGSDMGGSLRNPASFCNVVGLRPSMGRMPLERGYGWMARLATTGPMARTVADAALLLSVQAGPHSEDPITLPEAGAAFANVPQGNPKHWRIAYSPDLGGLPIHPDTAAVIADAAAQFANLGAVVETAEPGLGDAMDVFQTQRACALAATGRGLEKNYPDWRNHAKDTAIWNIEQGMALSAADIVDAELARTALYARMMRFFSGSGTTPGFDALILPAAQVPAFDVSMEYIDTINGIKLPTYIDWMAVCCAITVTGCPAISVPAGFTPEGMPVGLQIVAPPGQDLALLSIAQAFEQATQHHLVQPEMITHNH